jgi:hypothetical protein
VNVLKGPFKGGEAEIAKNAEYSFLYSENVLKRRFTIGEAAISTNGGWSYLYAKHVLKRPFKGGEAEIAKSEYRSKYEEFVGYKI